MIYALDDHRPDVDPSAWVAHDANVIGKIYLGPKSSVWFCATLRGDNELIRIEAGANVQECCVLHTDIGHPMVVGENVTIGHAAILHGCQIGARTLVGMGAIVMNGAKIGTDCLIAAGALVSEGREIPPRSLVIGRPGKVVRDLTDDEVAGLLRSATGYQAKAVKFANGLQPITD
jgi:carbonic anhydrase/acetyltransferase-like protein (isoleucine patch superfamily)